VRWTDEEQIPHAFLHYCPTGSRTLGRPTDWLKDHWKNLKLGQANRPKPCSRWTSIERYYILTQKPLARDAAAAAVTAQKLGNVFVSRSIHKATLNKESSGQCLGVFERISALPVVSRHGESGTLVSSMTRLRAERSGFDFRQDRHFFAPPRRGRVWARPYSCPVGSGRSIFGKKRPGPGRGRGSSLVSIWYWG
jgi:hypothetical protein